VNPDEPTPYIWRATVTFANTADTMLARRLVREAVAKFGVRKLISPLSNTVLLLGGALDAGDLIVFDAAAADAFTGDRQRFYEWKEALYKWLGRPVLQRAYADSVRMVLEPLVRGLPEDNELRAELALRYAKLGMEREALREIERALVRVRGRPTIQQTTVRKLAAEAYMELGQQDAAIDHLAYLLSVPSWMSVGPLRVDKLWDPLRTNPRFQRLLAENR